MNSPDLPHSKRSTSTKIVTNRSQLLPLNEGTLKYLRKREVFKIMERPEMMKSSMRLS
jgi:hypothetical protein